MYVCLHFAYTVLSQGDWRCAEFVVRRGRLGNGRTADELLRVTVRGGYGGLACACDGMHGSWRKWNCVGSAGCVDKCASSADKCVGSVDKCASSADKCAGSIDKCVGSVDKCVGCVDKCVGCVDKCVGCVYTLK